MLLVGPLVLMLLLLIIIVVSQGNALQDFFPLPKVGDTGCEGPRVASRPPDGPLTAPAAELPVFRRPLVL